MEEKHFEEWIVVKEKLHFGGSMPKIPLTSQDKSGSWYVKFDFKGREQTAVLSQIRMLSVSRLSSRMGELDMADIDKIKRALFDFLK